MSENKLLKLFVGIQSAILDEEWLQAEILLAKATVEPFTQIQLELFNAYESIINQAQLNDG